MSPRKPPVTSSEIGSPDCNALSFELAIAELEALIQSVENNRLPLEETLNAYQRGQQLIGRCNILLKDAEQRLQQFDDSTPTDMPTPEQP
jgi:exodeoxyribonuclease VII small subunit